MRCSIILCLALWAGRSGAGWIQRPLSDQAQAVPPPGDVPGGSALLLMVEAMSHSFKNMASSRSSWFDRYQDLTQNFADNSAVTTELLGISRIAMPIIWKTYMGSQMLQRSERLQRGGGQSYDPSDVDLPAPHPLRSLTTRLTDQDDYTVEVVLRLTEEANVGLRMMYEPEEGAEFDWANDDIPVTVHIRWHFAYGNSREVAMNDKHGGRWGPNISIIGGDRWPHLVVNHKFLLVLKKRGNCYYSDVLVGEEMYFYDVRPLQPQVFCPSGRRQSKMAPEPRRLRVEVNEDQPGAGQLQVYSIVWYPDTEPQMVPPTQHF